MKIKKVLSLLLATVMATSCFSGAFAESSVPVKVTTEPAVISVTVPLSLPCVFDENFDMIIPTTKPKITNNSPAPVKISSVKLDNINSEWSSDISLDLKEQPIDTKKFTFRLNDESITENDPLSENGLFYKFNVITPADSEEFSYKMIIPAQSQAINDDTLCNLVFVFGWAD